MPSLDHFFRPRTDNYPNSPFGVAISGAVIRKLGFEKADQEAWRLLALVQLLTPELLQQYGAGLSPDISRAVSDLWSRQGVSTVAPESIGEFYSHFGLSLNPAQARSRFSNRIAVVFYFDPGLTTLEAQAEVYRPFEVAGSGERGVTLIRVPGLGGVDRYLEIVPSLVSALYVASAVANGRYSGRTELEAREIRDHLSRNFQFDVARSSVLETLFDPHGDRLGMRFELPGVRIGEDLPDAPPEVLWARTQEEVLGEALIRLRSEAGRTVVEIAQLRTEDYASPAIHFARAALVSELERKDAGRTLLDVLSAYNRRLFQILGSDAAARFQLEPASDSNQSDISVTARTSGARYEDPGVEIRVPYAALATEAFEKTLVDPELAAGFVRAHTASENMAARLARDFPDGVSGNLKSFLFQLVFEEIQWHLAGIEREDAPDSRVVLQTSREDVIYSILSEDELRELRSWYLEEGSETFLRGQFEAAGIPAEEGSPVWDRIDRTFDLVIGERVATGRAGLAPVFEDTDFPGKRQVRVAHTGISEEDRRPVLETEDGHYVSIAFRGRENPFARLVTGYRNWFENSGLEPLYGLVPDAVKPDAYAIAASRFLASIAPLLSTPRGRVGEGNWRQEFQDALNRIPESLPATDGAGRIAKRNGIWWLRLDQAARKLSDLATGLKEPVLIDQLEARFSEGFGLDLKTAPPQLDQVWFENGAFRTWRGRISLEEVGLPDSWRPGDGIAGYGRFGDSHSSTTYRSTETESPLPEAFELAWNGIPGKSSTPSDLPAANGANARFLTIDTGAKGFARFRRIRIPIEARRISDRDGLVFKLKLEEVDGLSITFNALDYIASDGSVRGSVLQDFVALKRLFEVLRRTRSGRDVLNRIRALPRTKVPGEGDVALRMTLAPSEYRVIFADGKGRPQTATLRAGQLDPVMRELGRIAFGVDALPVPDGQDARGYRARLLLRIVNGLREELGRPLVARTHRHDTEIVVPLDGSAPLVDENLKPISPMRLREQVLILRALSVFREKADALSPGFTDADLTLLTLDTGFVPIMERLRSEVEKNESGPERFDELQALRRLILEARYAEERARLDVEGAELYREPAEPIPHKDTLAGIAMDDWQTWRAKVMAHLGTGELSSRARLFLENEIRGLQDGRRDAWDAELLLDGLSPALREHALIRLAIAADKTRTPALDAVLKTHAHELAALESRLENARIAEENRATLNRNILDGVVIPRRDVPPDSRLVYLVDGVETDERGRPVLPWGNDALTDIEWARILERFEPDPARPYTGRLRIGPTYLEEEPVGSLLEEAPALADPDRVTERLQHAAQGEDPDPLNPDEADATHFLPELDRERMEALGALLPGGARRDQEVKRAITAMEESVAESVQIQLEVKRDHARLVKAVIEKIRAYNEETGGDWVMVPDSEVFDGNDIHFKVVERSAVTAGEGPEDPPVIPDSARKVRLTVNTEGLLVSPGLLEKKKAEAERLANGENGEEGEGAGRFDGVKSAVGVTTFAGGLMLAGIGFLQAIRGLEEHENWETVYGAATATYFAGHAGVGGLAQAFKTSLGKRLIAGATDLLESATDSAIEGIAKLTGKTVVEVAAKLGKFGAIAARGASSVAGVIGEIIPFVGVAVGAVMIGLDTLHLAEAKTTIEKVQYGTDLAFDTIVTVVDVIGSAFPPAEIVTAPLSLIINITRMIFDSAIVEVQAELAKLPDDATDDEKALAVVNGIGFGIRDFIRNLTPWAAIEDSIKIDREHNQDLAYIHSLNDPATYFGIHPVDGVTGETALDFEIGSNSLSGGDVVAHLGEPGAETTISIGDVPVNQLASGDGTLATHSLDWRGVLSANTDFVMLGFGESYAIETTAAKAYLFWAIPVDTQTVISGTGDNRASRVGTYFGNSRGNTFIGPTIASLADEDGDTEDERTRKADMRTTLRTYHYNLHGGAGDDTFMVGGAVSHLHGDAGRDTYIINENNYFYIHNEAEDRLTDTLVLSNQLLFRLGIEINPWQLAEQADNLGINYMGHTADGAHPTESTIGLLVDYLESDLHQHLQIRTQDGYVITLDGDHLAAERDAGRRHYVLRSEDITGLFLNEHQGPTFDADQRTVSVYESGSVVTRRTGQTATTTPARFQTLRLHHIENIFGDERTNTLSGNALANYIHGGDGNDYLYGRGGDDILVGGAAGIDTPGTIMSLLSGGDGNDTLISSPERSQLFGGGGQDTYILHEGISTVEIRDVADEKNNLVKLPIAARNLRSSVEGTTLVLRDGTDADRVVRVLEWTTRGALYEFHTGDGFIYLKDGNGLSLGGFDGNTFRTREVDTGVSASQGGFAVEVYDLPTGAGRPTLPSSFDRVLASGRLVAEGRITGIDFEGGTPPRFRFDMDEVSAIRNWVIEKEARRALLPENARVPAGRPPYGCRHLCHLRPADSGTDPAFRPERGGHCRHPGPLHRRRRVSAGGLVFENGDRHPACGQHLPRPSRSFHGNPHHRIGGPHPDGLPHLAGPGASRLQTDLLPERICPHQRGDSRARILRRRGRRGQQPEKMGACGGGDPGLPRNRDSVCQ